MVTAIASSLRNSFRDALATALDGGSVVVKATATTLVTFSLGSSPFTNGTGTLTLTATKTATASGGSGATPTSADWRDSSNNVLFTVTSGLSGTELNWDGTITSGQTCNLSSGYVLTIPAN